MLLRRRFIAKPWGRDDVPGYAGAERIGEAWFEGGPPGPLLVKYLYTSEALSIQVHPNDAQARAAGLPAGKTECWYIVAAAAGATIGLGLRQGATAAAVRDAAIDGTLPSLLMDHPVAAGDFLFVPAGTIHAIGGGITLVEIQQNSDVTFRLFDYGRPRPLQLDEGLAVARLEPFDRAPAAVTPEGASLLLADDAAFAVRLARGVDAAVQRLEEQVRWVVVLAGVARSDGDVARVGDCLYLPAGAELILDAATSVLIATAGPAAQDAPPQSAI